MKLLFQIRIDGRVGIKKNSKTVIRKGSRYIPINSKKYREWESIASSQVTYQVESTNHKPILDPITAVYVFGFKNHAHEIDTSNGGEGISDVMEKCGVYKNDKQIINIYQEKRFEGEDYLQVYLFTHCDILKENIFQD